MRSIKPCVALTVSLVGKQVCSGDIHYMSWSKPGVAKLFDPRVEIATPWALENRMQCDLRNQWKIGC